MNHRLAIAITALCAVLPAQVNDAPTHFVWALDAGEQTAPTPLIRVYSPSGVEVATVAVPGSGQARALAFDRAGNAYICRGSVVHQLDRTGVTTGVTFSPPSGAGSAQDVVELPDSTIAVAWGATAAASAVATYDITGMLLTSFTDAALDHPRRITPNADPTSTLLYVANRGAQEIRVIDLAAMPQTMTLVTDLTNQNVGPVGLCYDNANDDLWVVSSWGDAPEIGCINLTTNFYATAINYPPSGATGLTAPAGVTYDRFRRLYVAGRNKNMGTAGVYVFEATSPSTAPAFLAYWPRVGDPPVNVIDVAPQPSESVICAPMEATVSGMQYILEMEAVNRVTFSNPATPGAPYAAAFSGEWSQNPCGAQFRQGVIDIGFSPPDVRGIPLNSDDFLWGSAAVSTPGASLLTPAINPITMMPFLNDLTGLGIDITGFIGDLNASGFTAGLIDLSGFSDPANAAGTDGMKLELAFVTFDFSEPSFFGYVSQPLCLTLRNPQASPVVAIPCP